MYIEVRDLDEDNLEDVFRVCSHRKLEDPTQRKGMELKRGWLLEMLDRYGPTTKLAYLDGKPVAQILFYPEDSIPYVENPREGVMLLNCVYNPFPEARGKGCGKLLVKSLIHESSRGLGCLGGRPCRFIVANPFNTGEGIPLEQFYSHMGFKKAQGEMYMEITASYQPRCRRPYTPQPEDRDRAIALYNPLCEYSYPFALRVKESLNQIDPSLTVELIDSWRNPQEAKKRGNHWLIVNSTPITSFLLDREAFSQEVLEAIRKK
ncbi:GNAT family N-acetyltransferase [Candidatus Bathyarchaeota archaeon]|nr:GNAT family N-acetyltransferase [Candidatus Bathyarchaeota archaeon]